MKALIAVMLLACFIAPVHAHKVVGGVYAIGSLIEGEAGFSNGDMAHEGTVVTVTDAQNQPLGTSVIDAQGMFQFQALKQQDHHFHIELGAGHVLNLVLSANELPDSLGRDKAAASSEELSAPATAKNQSRSKVICWSILLPHCDEAVPAARPLCLVTRIRVC